MRVLYTYADVYVSLRGMIHQRGEPAPSRLRLSSKGGRVGVTRWDQRPERVKTAQNAKMDEYFARAHSHLLTRIAALWYRYSRLYKYYCKFFYPSRVSP